MAAKKINSLTISIGILLVFLILMMKISSSAGVQSPVNPVKPVLPKFISDWKYYREIDIPDDILKILGTKEAVLGEYLDKGGDSLNLYILKSSGRRSVIHPPEYCYMGSGKNELLGKGTRLIEDNKGNKLAVNYLYVQVEHGFQVVIYFYTANDMVTHNYYKQQFNFLINRLKNKKIEGCLIRISKYSQNDDFEQTLKKLQPVVKQLLKYNSSKQNKNF